MATPSKGILLTDTPAHAADDLSYRIISSEEIGCYRIAIAEEAPTRRLVHYTGDDFEGEGDGEDEDDDEIFDVHDPQKVEYVFDIPLPWIYTYWKFANGNRGWQLWQCALFFSPEKITHPLDQRVYSPYLPNVNGGGSICFGSKYDRSATGTVETDVSRQLDNFWMRQFNAEVTPMHHPYTKALKTAFGMGQWMHIEGFLDALSHRTVDEVLAVPLQKSEGLKLQEQIWLPGHHHAYDAKLAAHGEYLNEYANFAVVGGVPTVTDDDEDHYDDDLDDYGEYDDGDEE